MLRKLLFLLFLILLSGRAFCQDILVLTNNDSLRVNVIAITPDKIKFRYFSVKEGPVLEVSKNQVKEIIYKNGGKLTIIYNIYEVSPDKMIPEKTHVFKIDLLAPLLNHFTIGYEWRLRKLKYYRNAEIKLGIIGPYINTDLKYAEGALVKVAIKFIKATPSYMKGLKYYQPMNGYYIKPELLASYFMRREVDFKVVYFTNIAACLNFGRQIVVNNWLTIDYFGGAGFGIQIWSYKKNSQYEPNNFDFNYAFSHLFLGSKIPVILTGGMLMGITF